MIFIKFFTQQNLPPKVASSFNSKVQRFKYDSLKGVLVEDGFDDVQELVDSCADTSLKKVLDKFGFLPVGYTEQISVSRLDADGNISDKLDQTRMAYEKADSLRAKLGLPDSLSVSEVFAACAKVAAQLGDSLKKQSSKSNDVKKDGDSDATEV